MNQKETVGFFLKKPKYGIENYEPRKLSLNLVPPKAFQQQKFKRETFMVSVPKLTDYVPGPANTYNITTDWAKRKPSHT